MEPPRAAWLPEPPPGDVQSDGQTTPCAIKNAGGTKKSTSTNWIWILDTGIDLDHPDLSVGNIAPYAKSFIPGETHDDGNGHGTHVAGIAAAKNNSFGTVGVSAGALVIPVKVLANSGMASFTYMISLGISQANTIRVSHQMGVKDYKALKMAAFASTQLVLVFMSSMGILFIFTRNYLPFLFTADPEVVKIASGLLIIGAIFQVFDGLQVVMLSTLRGMADVRLPMFIAFFAYLFLGIPTSYFLAFNLMLGPQGIWYGYLLGLGTAGILFYLRFQYNLKKRA